MSLFLDIISHTLQFKFDARTSRGAMQQHQVYYFKLYDPANSNNYGLGECAPLPGLSLEYNSDFRDNLNKLQKEINQRLNFVGVSAIDSIIYDKNYKDFPAVVFALETAWLDLKRGGKRILFDNPFTQSSVGIPINGLIWMGDKSFMQAQIKKKLDEGYACLKLKIGGLDFDAELDILKAIRQVASAETLTIRLDVNGAFTPVDALNKLKELSAYAVHSIEQPIKPGQWEAMRELCIAAPIPIALDEELIGIKTLAQKEELVNALTPSYLILKPTLLGGLKVTKEWIDLAQKKKIGWWITSALESNIGLNAISQFTAEYNLDLEQGLGTGQLYHNNIASPLHIASGKLYYDTTKIWNTNLF